MNGKRVANLICLKRNIEELGCFWKRFWEPGEIHWLFNYRNFGTELLNELILSQLMKGCLSEGGMQQWFIVGYWYQQSLSATNLFKKAFPLSLPQIEITSYTSVQWGRRKLGAMVWGLLRPLWPHAGPEVAAPLLTPFSVPHYNSDTKQQLNSAWFFFFNFLILHCL